MVIMNEETQKDRIRGSLIGGAIGDALGYPVEFIDSYAGIQRRYGDAGITRLDVRQWWKNEDSSTGYGSTPFFFCIQYATGCKQRHLCVIRNPSFSSRTLFVLPPLSDV